MAGNDEDRYFSWAAWPIPVGVIGIALWFWGTAAYPPVYETEMNFVAVPLGLLVSAAYIGVAATRVRGEQNWQVRLLIVAAMAAFGWTILVVGAAPVVNALLGSKTEETHYAKVLQVRRGNAKALNAAVTVAGVAATRGRRYRRSNVETFELLVEAWIPGNRSVLFTVRPGELESVEYGKATHMVIVTRRGLFGAPWVVSSKVADNYHPAEVASETPPPPAVAEGPLEWDSGNLVWLTGSAEAWKQSQATQKVMFVLFHDADRAAHQALMPMLTSPEAAAVLERCVPLRLDITDPVGQKAAGSYGVTQTPTLMAFDLAGKPKGRVLVDPAAAPTWEKVYAELRASAASQP